MATQLSITNRVLVRLREEQVNTTQDTPESQIISDFVIQAHDEVRDFWTWRSLRHPIAVDLTSSKRKYDLSQRAINGGDLQDSVTTIPKNTSQLEFVVDSPNVFIFDDINDSEGLIPTLVSREAIQKMASQGSGNASSDNPSFVSFHTAEQSEALELIVWPSLNGSRVLRAVFFTPPDSLQPDGSTDNDTLIVPSIPIFLLALAYATEERGEERHQSVATVFRQAQAALGQAIENDYQLKDRTGRFDWDRR